MSTLCTEVPLTNYQRLIDWQLKKNLMKLNGFMRKVDPELALPDAVILEIYDGSWPNNLPAGEWTEALPEGEDR